MTNKEAISIITQIKGIIANDNSWSDVAKVAVKEAFDLAIKALEGKPQGESEKWKCCECYIRAKETGALLFCEAVGKCKFEKGGVE